MNLADVFQQLRRMSTMDTALIPQPSREPRPHRYSVDTALARLTAVIPGAAEARATRYWGGMIDMTPDGLPIIDGACGPQGLTIITGLSGHGLAIGPVLGQIAADLCLDGTTLRPIGQFSLSRFNTGTVHQPEIII